MGGFVKPVKTMENQQVLNSISTLAGSIDPLVRAKDANAVKKVVEKLLEMVDLIGKSEK